MARIAELEEALLAAQQLQLAVLPAAPVAPSATGGKCACTGCDAAGCWAFSTGATASDPLLRLVPEDVEVLNVALEDSVRRRRKKAGSRQQLQAMLEQVNREEELLGTCGRRVKEALLTVCEQSVDEELGERMHAGSVTHAVLEMRWQSQGGREGPLVL